MTTPQLITPAGILPVAETAVRLLAAVVDWYATHDGAEALPERQYIAAGDPRTVAWDGPQVTVSVSSMPLATATNNPSGPGQAGRVLASGRTIRSVTYEVAVVRCYDGWSPNPTQAPAAEVLHAAGLSAMTDLEQLTACLTNTVTSKALVAEGHPPPQVLLGTLETLGPDGGLTGIAAPVAISMT